MKDLMHESIPAVPIPPPSPTIPSIWQFILILILGITPGGGEKALLELTDV